MEFEDESWKTFAHGEESSTVEPEAQEGFGQHDPAGAVVIDDILAFSKEGEQCLSWIELVTPRSWRNHTRRR